MDNKKIKGSCKNQHIIPQFLQKQFTTNEKLFRHTKEKSFIVNVSNNFSENEYYSERPYENSKELTLDQKITKQENEEYSHFLHYLLSLKTDKEFIVNDEISKFIYHFIFRNKKIISSVIEALEYRFSQTCSTEKSFKEKIFEKIKIKLIPEFKINNFNCKWGELKEKFYDSYDNVMCQARSYWFDSKIKNARKLHDLCLNDNTYLTNFKFQIIEGYFVLPNTVLIAYNSKAAVQYLPYVDCETEHILFPLSSNKLLVIYKNSFPQLNKKLINEYLVSSCDEFCSELNEKDPLIINLKKYFIKNEINDELNCDIEEAVKKSIKNTAEIYTKKILNEARTQKGWRKVK